MENNITYLLCMNEEGLLLYEESINRLIESNCKDFMVYKLVDGNRNYQTDIDIWQVEIEINEQFYSMLHLNLCQKFRPISKP
ncbi:hypothetical protein [Flagellimonas sp.]|uniref:hypothetical protein n=1 Tax=Flagellimonas sp. TaxID=2058762 RepID=UPI003B5ACA35